ncbi:MAG: FixH family protein [Flavobacteriales bacterium]|nr:FixH family protein [Flavobacteriales bacterium]HPF90324.1 FixH family protein [Flavobacteriales bacterium]
MNWGKGIALALTAFAVMMGWFLVKASQNPEPLVTEDYYAEELRFQQRIDGMVRAQKLSAPVAMTFERGRVVLRFPHEMEGEHLTGNLQLIRPNAPMADRSIPFRTDRVELVLNEVELLPGRYNAALTWTARGEELFTEEKVFVP